MILKDHFKRKLSFEMGDNAYTWMVVDFDGK